jgi:uncharacterized circularly permuted ATP-grasp superfamily protein
VRDVARAPQELRIRILPRAKGACFPRGRTATPHARQVRPLLGMDGVQPRLTMLWRDYSSHTFDELLNGDGRPRPAARNVSAYIDKLGADELRRRQRAATAEIRAEGITFVVSGEHGNIDREWPFDVIPRVIDAAEWDRIDRGLQQRLAALNCFIGDLYGPQRVIRAGVLPEAVLKTSRYFLDACRGITPKHGVWAHICGSDLVRDADGSFYVLEDNLRVPSGVSYMLENRSISKRVFPELFEDQSIRPVDGYTSRLYALLVSLAPEPVAQPKIVLLTPGVSNSAYFEHCFLAQQMGIDLVEGSDLVVRDDRVYVRTIGGLERVDVIYRRIGDEFLDPEAFNTSSLIGCRGLMRAWRAGNVALANAPGAGVADDKLVYSYVPDLVRYYLGEEAIIPNVETFRLFEEKHRRHVLADLRRFVVKPANESGGYGVVVGSKASAEELEQARAAIEKDARNYVAQPIVQLSTAPTLCEEGIEPRHLDLRPFVLSGADGYVTRGGLTRVALRKGSLVVNSSQGGGSKDTLIVETGGGCDVALPTG